MAIIQLGCGDRRKAELTPQQTINQLKINFHLQPKTYGPNFDEGF